MAKDVEIAIDDVKGLGFFIELEARKHFHRPKDGKIFLYKKIQNLLN